MARFDDGVSGYVKGTATVVNYFPIDRRGHALCACDACRFFRRSSKVCGLTGEVIPWPENYVGRNCPLETTEEE